MTLRKDGGITLIALVITIIILTIVSSIAIVGTMGLHKQTKENVLIVELNMIQHAILERKAKAELTGEELPGTNINKIEVEKIIGEINNLAQTNITLKGKDGDYKKLNQPDLEKLGVEKENEVYIVNYKTGEVINTTQKVTQKGKALYVYATE